MQTERRGYTVVLATDVRLIHDSLEWAIGRRVGYSIVGAANSSQELLRLAASLKPNLGSGVRDCTIRWPRQSHRARFCLDKNGCFRCGEPGGGDTGLRGSGCVGLRAA